MLSNYGFSNVNKEIVLILVDYAIELLSFLLFYRFVNFELRFLPLSGFVVKLVLT